MALAIRTALIGVLATLLMDLWGMLREPLFGFPRANYRLIGRWFAYMPRGRFRHASIAASPLPGCHTTALARCSPRSWCGAAAPTGMSDPHPAWPWVLA